MIDIYVSVIEIFGGNLPVVTIERGMTKLAGNCKTKRPHVTNPEFISYYISKKLF